MPYQNTVRSNPYTISQNFLTSKYILSRIVNLSNIGPKDTVLEIGTGKGHLACTLANRCGMLHTIEIDKSLYHKAQQRLQPFHNIRLTHGDFLRMPLPGHIPYKVFANLPFSITTKIIEKLTGTANPPTEMWLVMEKGTAKRFLGKPKETLRSLLLKPYWDLRIVYYFKREDFHPRPSVDIVLVHFKRKQIPDIPPQHKQQYRFFVSQGFAHCIAGNNRLLTKKQVSQALKHAGHSVEYHNGLMLYVQWLCLFRCWHSQNDH